MAGHYVEVCEYHQVHGQCRCASPDKTIRKVVCNNPIEHRDKLRKQSSTGYYKGVEASVSVEQLRPVLDRLRHIPSAYAVAEGQAGNLDRLLSLVYADVYQVGEQLKDLMREAEGNGKTDPAEGNQR